MPRILAQVAVGVNPIGMQESDPGYEAYASLRKSKKDLKVFLDGVEQRNCITADDKTGEILRYREGSQTSDFFETETIKGVVRFEIYEF